MKIPYRIIGEWEIKLRECACFLASVSQIIADSQHFVGHFAPVMYEGFHPLDIHPSGARTCQALCWVQTRILHSYSALQKWDYMLLPLACFIYWRIINITVQSTPSSFLVPAWCHFPLKWLYNNLISPLLSNISIISGLQILYQYSLKHPCTRILHIWMDECFWG